MRGSKVQPLIFLGTVHLVLLHLNFFFGMHQHTVYSQLKLFLYIAIIKSMLFNYIQIHSLSSCVNSFEKFEIYDFVS